MENKTDKTPSPRGAEGCARGVVTMLQVLHD